MSKACRNPNPDAAAVLVLQICKYSARWTNAGLTLSVLKAWRGLRFSGYPHPVSTPPCQACTCLSVEDVYTVHPGMLAHFVIIRFENIARNNLPHG